MSTVLYVQMLIFCSHIRKPKYSNRCYHDDSCRSRKTCDFTHHDQRLYFGNELEGLKEYVPKKKVKVNHDDEDCDMS
jgi:hypothetical protein